MSPKTVYPNERAAHVLIPVEDAHRLRGLSKRTRVCQSVMLRDAVDALLIRYNSENGAVGTGPTAESRTDYAPRGRMVSIVFRMNRGSLAELHELSKRTRVRQSEFLREAINSILHTENEGNNA